MLNNKLNLLTYFPFIGWMIPLAFNKKDSFAIYHVKQGIIMALFFTVILVTITFSTVFFPKNYRILRMIVIILTYILYLIYFAMCIVGTVRIKNGKIGEFGILKRFSMKLDL